MALNRPGVNFKSDAKALIVPTSVDNPGLSAVDVTHTWHGGIFGAPAATDPLGLGSGDKGYLYFNTSLNVMRCWDGTSWNTLTMTTSGAIETPTITSFTPSSGASGTSVVISGTFFTGATAVAFAGTAAAGFVVNSNTQITAVSPTGASTGQITVTTPVGTATSSGNFTPVVGPGPASYVAAVLADNPKHFWTLQGSSITTAGVDSGVGTHRTFSENGGSPTYHATGPMGTDFAVTFAASKYFTAPSCDLGTSDYTVECFVKTPASFSNSPNLWRTDQPFVTVNLDTSGHIVVINQNIASLGATTNALALSTIYHIVIAYNHTGQQTKVYVNGTLFHTYSTTSALFNNGGSFYLSNGSGAGWPGDISYFACWDSLLSAAQIAAHFSASSYAATVLALVPVAYLRLNETSGSSFADLTGNGHTGTTRSGGTVTAGTNSSPMGSGATLGGGAADFITMPDSAALDITGDVTFICWIKTPFTATGDGGYQTWMSKGADSPGFGYALRTNPTRHLEFLKADSAVLGTSSGQVANDNAWHMIAVTRSGNTITFYIDGASAGTATSSTTTSATDCPFGIGNECTGTGGVTNGSEPCGGVVADVAIFSTALSGANIAAIYAAS